MADPRIRRLADLEAELVRLKAELTDHVFTIVIEGNPGRLGINHAKKPALVAGRARLVDDGKSRKAKRAAAAAVQRSAFEQAEAAHAVSEAPTIIVEIDTYWERRRRLVGVDDLAIGDVDGPLKLTIDALEKAKVIDDDVRVIEVRGRKFLDRERPRIEMRVMPAPPREAQTR